MFDLQITSLLDILVILLVFLLKSASVSINSLQAVPGIEIPVSYSEEVPPDSLMLVITPTNITFENTKVLDFVQTAESLDSEPLYQLKKTDLDEGGLRIVPLYDLLMEARERAEVIRAKSQARDENGNPLPFEGILAIQADKRVNYNVMRRVLYTGGTAGFKVFRFLAMKKEE